MVCAGFLLKAESKHSGFRPMWVLLVSHGSTPQCIWKVKELLENRESLCQVLILIECASSLSLSFQ